MSVFQIHGCSDVVVSANEMRIMDCNVYSVRANALVEEEGTGVLMTASSSTSITRTAVSFKSVYKDDFMKPNLPYRVKVSPGHRSSPTKYRDPHHSRRII